jgi:hypothetical protein
VSRSPPRSSDATISTSLNGRSPIRGEPGPCSYEGQA